MSGQVLRRRALLLRQDDVCPLYLFALKASEVAQVAGISRVSRDEDHKLIGYQRKEVRRHVDDIREYLDEGGALFPNALILAFTGGLTFRRSRGPSSDDGLAQSGVVEIQLPPEGQPLPAWIVDGQQRALALAATSSKDMAVPVAAFAGAGLDKQRDQFLRINNARPLPRGLVTELLPEVDTYLPRRLAARKLPSAICGLLNRHPDSPFFGLIRRPSTADSGRKAAVVTDTSIVEMVKARLIDVSGCLFPYRNIATGETDVDAVVKLLIAYWRAVRTTFPEAWGKPPNHSRLMHGAGIKAVGNLMDAVLARQDPNAENLEERCVEELGKIAPLCRWTKGQWEGLGGTKWNHIENTSRSIKTLSNFLAREYILALHKK